MRCLNVLPAGNVLRRWLAAGVVGCLLLAGGARGQSATTAAYDRFMATATGATQTTVTYGTNGTPVASASSMTLTPDTAAGGAANTSQTGTIRNPAGNGQSITTTGKVPPAKAAAIIGKAIIRGFMIYSVGEAIFDLAKEMQYAPNPDGTWSKTSPTGGLIFKSGANCIPMGAVTGEECADKLEVALFGNDAGRFRAEYSVPPGHAAFPCSEVPGRWCLRIMNYNQPANPSIYATYTEGTSDVTSDEQSFINDIASKSGWPSTSNIARATAAAATSLGADSGLAPTVTTVTGPSQTQGRKATRSSTNADGSTRTETEDCKWDHTYAGAVITSKETCTTTVTNDGTAGKTTTKTETKEGESEQKTEPPPDPCEKAPQRAGCMDVDVPEGEIPKSTFALTYAAESLGFGGGSCPADVVQSIGGQSITVFSYSEGCALISDYLKPLVLLLSAWTAFIILIPGARTE